MRKINTEELVPANAFDVLKTQAIYASPYTNSGKLNNQFPALYHPKAQVVWAHKDIITITVLAANICHQQFGWRLCVVDCLRSVEAQEEMKAYGHHPDLVSLPGTGAHPRAMAIDIVPEYQDSNGWQLVDMGVPFDHFVPDPQDSNPAAHGHTRFDGGVERSQSVFLNRKMLEFAMLSAAEALNIRIWPLEQEWWDFRLSEELYEGFFPLMEKDLQPVQRLISPDVGAVDAILAGSYPEAMLKVIRDVHSRVSVAWNNLFYQTKPYSRCQLRPTGMTSFTSLPEAG